MAEGLYMKRIIQITDLRNTNEISKICHQQDSPIFITKHGYEDMVIMSNEYYLKKSDNLSAKDNIEKEHIEFENQDDCLGFIKVSSVNINCKINQISHNENEIINSVKMCSNKGAKIIVFPELSLTSYSCGDMFLSSTLLNEVIKSIKRIQEKTKDIDAFFAFGAPLINQNLLYNCAVCMHKGKILGVVPKTFIPNYNEFYEKRYFKDYINDSYSSIIIGNELIPFGNNLLFQNTRYKDEIIGIEICEDMWVNIPRSSKLSELGANIICNLSSSNETLFKNQYRKDLIKTNSKRSKVGYIYSSSSFHESTSDLIFSGHNIICEPDDIISESELFEESSIISEIDLTRIVSLKRQENMQISNIECKIIPFSCQLEIPILTRKYYKFPFISKENRLDYSRKVQLMQAYALIKRLETINCKDVVIGISGGLDSTIALLALIKAYDLLNYPRNKIHAITMPCFGTSSRTKSNAEILCEKLKVDLTTIDIKASVSQHLKDLNVSLDDRSVTYENAQARERTQVLMDYANKINGLVIGTGDLSEIALGWSTYNGDHMSMYNLNCSLPKTLIKEMCFQLSSDYPEIKDILLDILDTPVSPELLPAENDQISQLTEDAVGPYELHDFFLYHYIFHHLEIEKVYLIAKYTFKDIYSKEAIKKWLTRFVKRFFNNQFKRSCCPDGPKITEVSLSPRGDFRMPSDLSSKDILNIIDSLD